MPALLESTESAVRALRALQSEIFADECLQRNCAMDEDPSGAQLAVVRLTPMSMLDQFKVLQLSNPNDRLRLVAEICCERYGDYERMLALDALRAPLDLTQRRSGRRRRSASRSGAMTPPAPRSP